MLCQSQNDVYPAVIPAQAGIQFLRKGLEIFFSLGITRIRHFKIDGTLENRKRWLASRWFTRNYAQVKSVKIMLKLFFVWRKIVLDDIPYGS